MGEKVKERYKNAMQQWDSWREYIAHGGTASWPRDAFENLIACYEEDISTLELKINVLAMIFGLVLTGLLVHYILMVSNFA